MIDPAPLHNNNLRLLYVHSTQIGASSGESHNLCYYCMERCLIAWWIE